MNPGWLLTRYTLRLFSWSFLVYTASSFLLICLFDFSELQRRTVSKNLPLIYKLKMVLFKAPFLLEQLLPFVVFASAMAMFWRMNRNQEWTILRSFGLSIWQVSWPIVALAFGFGIWDLTLHQPVTAYFAKRHQHYNETYIDAKPDATVSLSRKGLWIHKQEDSKRFIYHIEKYLVQENQLEQVSIYLFSKDHVFQGAYKAEQGIFTSKGLQLYNGLFQGENGQSHGFKLKLLPFQLTPADLHRTNQDLQTFSFWELPKQIYLLEQAGLSSHKYRMQRAGLIARVFWLSAMILLAAAFSLQPLRQGKSFRLLLSGLGICFVLYVVRDFTHAFGMAQTLPVLLAAMAPPVLTFLLAVLLLMHFEEEKY